MVIQTWVFGKYFFKNHQNRSATLKKIIDGISCHRLFKLISKIFEFWKAISVTMIQVLKDFLNETGGNIMGCDFLILHNKMSTFGRLA